MTKARGFTLIEVMITVAIIAILGMLAYPSYADYVQRGRLAEARSQLMDARAKLEQYYQDNRQFTGADSAGFPCNSTTLNANTKYFTYSCTLTASTYTVTATGKAAEGMGDFAFTINQDGARATTGVPTGWSNPGTCWVMRKDGSC
jgi:type IV pilus assembly protein PilE